MQAIQELHMKAKNWRDLLTDEPFTRKDLITIQDPHNLQASTPTHSALAHRLLQRDA